MPIGEPKKEENQYQDSFLQSPEGRLHGPRRNKALSRFPARNRSIWRYSTLSKSLSGSSDYSRNSDTTLATKTPFTPTVKVLLRLPRTLSITQGQSTSIFNTTSSGTAWKMEDCDWNIVQRKIWLPTV